MYLHVSVYMYISICIYIYIYICSHIYPPWQPWLSCWCWCCVTTKNELRWWAVAKNELLSPRMSCCHQEWAATKKELLSPEYRSCINELSPRRRCSGSCRHAACSGTPAGMPVQALLQQCLFRRSCRRACSGFPAGMPVQAFLQACLFRHSCRHACSGVPAGMPVQAFLQACTCRPRVCSPTPGAEKSNILIDCTR